MGLSYDLDLETQKRREDHFRFQQRLIPSASLFLGLSVQVCLPSACALTHSHPRTQPHLSSPLTCSPHPQALRLDWDLANVVQHEGSKPPPLDTLVLPDVGRFNRNHWVFRPRDIVLLR